MGLEKDLATVAAQARQAYLEGKPVFVARFKLGAFSNRDHGEVDVFAENIAAVESVGWVLAQWNVVAEQSGAHTAYPVFRRAQSLIQDRI